MRLINKKTKEIGAPTVFSSLHAEICLLHSVMFSHTTGNSNDNVILHSFLHSASYFII